MIRTVEAVIDESGSIRLLQPVAITGSHRAFVMILDEEPASSAHQNTLLSEAALSDDWDRPEEESAWSYLQPDR